MNLSLPFPISSIKEMDRLSGCKPQNMTEVMELVFPEGYEEPCSQGLPDIKTWYHFLPCLFVKIISIYVMPNNDTRPQPFTDMPHNSWIDRWLPANVVPYAKAMRLDRPIGIWLLLIPGLWSIAMAARPQDMWHLIGFFT